MSNHESRPAPDRVRLRPVEPGDLPAFYQHQLDPAAIRMAAVNPRDLEAFNAHWLKILGNGNAATKAILVDDSVAGYITCFRAEGKDEIGYWIGREYWGKGIATQALAQLLEQVTTRPLHATTARSNVASLRALQRGGFAITGYEQTSGSERYPACEVAHLILT